MVCPCYIDISLIPLYLVYKSKSRQKCKNINSKSPQNSGIFAKHSLKFFPGLLGLLTGNPFLISQHGSAEFSYSMRVPECPQPAFKHHFSTNYTLLWKLLRHSIFKSLFYLWNSSCLQVWCSAEFFLGSFTSLSRCYLVLVKLP